MRRLPYDLLAAAAIAVWTLVQAYHRIHLGVSFNDEAFYAVVTQRFTLGDRPFIDEINLRQAASLLTVPFYWLYLKLVGSTDGVILFLRHIYLGLQLAVAWAVFRSARALVPASFALVIAATVLAFIPFACQTCNYNSLGALFFAWGMFLALLRLSRPGPLRTLFFAGTIHGFACIAYPPLGVAILLACAALPWVFPTDRGVAGRRAALVYALGVAAVGGTALVWLAPNLVRGIPLAISYEAMLTRERSWTKLVGILDAVYDCMPPAPLTATALAVTALLQRQAPSLRRWLVALPVLPIVVWFARVRPEFTKLVPQAALTLHMLIYIGLLAGFFIVLAGSGPGRRALWWMWLSSCVAALIMALASDNQGCMSTGLGMFTATLLCLLVAGIVADDPDLSRLGRLPIVLGLALVPVGLSVRNNDVVYGDDVIAALTTRVNTGPFEGLYTQPEKARRATALTEEIRAAQVPGERMLASYDIHAAYLSVPTRPALQTSWTDKRILVEPFLPYYQSHRTGRGLAVMYTGLTGKTTDLEKLIEKPERLVKDLGWFKIYREPPP